MSPYSNKLSSATKRLLSETPKGANPEQSFLIRTDGDLSDAQRTQLESLGEVHSVAGDIVTVAARLKAAPKFAALDFVRYLDASGPMYLEEESPGL